MVVTGFAIRMAVGVMSMGPGRVEIHEGTIAGTYHLLGMPLEEAVVVSVLFRVVFQLIPLALSLSLSWRMLRPTGTSVRLEIVAGSLRLRCGSTGSPRTGKPARTEEPARTGNTDPFSVRPETVEGWLGQESGPTSLR